MRSFLLLPLVASLAFAGQALAEPLNYNQVSLRAEVQRSVNNDTLTVVLFTEAQDRDPAELANRITETLNKGLDIARRNSAVKVSSGSRYSQPVYNDNRENIVAWRERGEIRPEGTYFAQVSAVTGDLLGILNLASMEFSLSPASRSAEEDKLIKEAIDAFKQRADIATESLGGSGYKIVQLSLNTQFMSPRPYMQVSKMARAADAEMAAPAVEGGEADVSVNADGVIEIQMP